LYYSYSDSQGSLIALVHEGGSVIQRFAYDPWGARRDPNNWNVKDSRTSFIINRGYTGHEHLDAFGIINMNGRVYDPLTAQFFSPDPVLTDAGNWLDYNRYGYCMGNPFKYTDPNGYSWNWKAIFTGVVSFGVGFGVGILTGGLGLVAAGVLAGSSSGLVGGVLGTALNGGSVGDCFSAGIKGAIIGGFAGAAGGGAVSALGNVGGGFFAGALQGAVGGTAGGFVGGSMNAWIGGASFADGLMAGLGGAAIGAVAGGLIGGTIKGIDAAVNGKANFWDGHVDLDLSRGYGASSLGKALMKIIRATYTGHKFYGTNIYESSALGDVTSSGGVTLPEYGIVVGNGVYKAYLDYYLYRTTLQHEYGHILQYKSYLAELGNAEAALNKYYTEVGLPSSVNASTSSYIDHANFNVEINANNLAKDFFGGSYVNDSNFPLIQQSNHNPFIFMQNIETSIRRTLFSSF